MLFFTHRSNFVGRLLSSNKHKMCACINSAVETTMALRRILADTNRLGKRTIDAHEGALGESCESGPSKKPKPDPCESTTEEDKDNAELDEEEDDDDEEENANALDTTDADPATKGSWICVIESCGKRSTWGPIVGARASARFCGPHGKAHGGCVDVSHRRCKEPGCKSLSPSFGPVGGVRKDATHCSDHGKPKGYVCIVNPRCQQNGCDKYASFGLPGGKKIRCGEHHVNKLCQHVGACPLNPSDGVKGRPSNKEEHEDVAKPRRVTADLLPKKSLHPKSKTRPCNECDPAINDRRKKKEEEVKATLEVAFTNVHRKLPVQFCGEGADRTASDQNPSLRARCDFLIDNERAVVLVEVDDFHDKDYCLPLEIARAHDIVAALLTDGDHRHVHFVRFNPNAVNINKQKRYTKLVDIIKATLASSEEKHDTWSLQYM